MDENELREKKKKGNEGKERGGGMVAWFFGVFIWEGMDTSGRKG